MEKKISLFMLPISSPLYRIFFAANLADDNIEMSDNGLKSHFSSFFLAHKKFLMSYE
jgi:hypothetical protein